MKKSLILAAFLAATSASAQWTAPEYAGPTAPLSVGDTVYIYNKEAKQFLTEGNDWGTHLSVGNEGLKCWVNEYALDGQEWDGATYTIGCYSETKKGNFLMFFEANGHMYVDGSTEKTDLLFSFVDKGDNAYQIVGGAGNPTYNASGDMAGYLVGRYTNYVNSRDGIATGTGVMYDYPDYPEGEFQTMWTFVKQADYADYAEKVAVYNCAVAFGEKLSAAEALGVTGLEEEKAVYNNLNSTVADFEAAAVTLEKKILAYYEVTVNPENPVIINQDECNAVSGWDNSIGATTWNTQTWIGDGWTGFEGTTLNVWGASMNGAVSKSFTDLPKGIYVVSVAVFSEKMDAYAFANENKKSIAAGAAGKTYEVTTEVNDGTLTCGVGMDGTGENWLAIDNASVKYYGAGVEAYRYWLNGLLESAPSFDDARVQNSLVSEYADVLASVNTATTKEEILAIIPAYEEVLNRINLNIDAYSNLKNAIDAADKYVINANEYYSNQINDYISETATAAYEDHEMGTEEVNAIVSALEALENEAQEYLWKKETLDTQTEALKTLYEEYSATCKPADADAAAELIKKIEEMDFCQKSCADVVALIEEVYAAQFNLQVPAEEATDENPVDYTAKISYPSYDSNADGWTNDGWSTCGNNTGWYGFATVEGALGDQNYLNLWTASAVCSVSQTLTGLPNGTYVVKVGAYADASGFEVFANDDALPVNVGQTGNGERGEWYEIVTEVTDGTLTIGARNTEAKENWCMIDNWSLLYCGTHSEKVPTDITSVNGASASTAIYSLSGVRTASFVKGVNIVKMADGSVRKIMIK